MKIHVNLHFYTYYRISTTSSFYLPFCFLKIEKKCFNKKISCKFGDQLSHDQFDQFLYDQKYNSIFKMVTRHDHTISLLVVWS
jgi:hypothetical protein